MKLYRETIFSVKVELPILVISEVSRASPYSAYFST